MGGLDLRNRENIKGKYTDSQFGGAVPGSELSANSYPRHAKQEGNSRVLYFFQDLRVLARYRDRRANFLTGRRAFAAETSAGGKNLNGYT